MASRVNTVHLSPAAADVTSRPVVITFADGVTPAITVDMMDPTVTFAANDGDSISAVATDVNITGQSVPSAPFLYTVAVTPPPPPPPTVPVSPTILGISSV